MYEAKPRAHHTMKWHLRECFQFYETLRRVPGDTVCVEMALWFHDAIQLGQSTDELMSSEFCKFQLMNVGVSETLADHISRIILIDHTRDIIETTTTDADWLLLPERKILADVDLWILAAHTERYQLYESQIRDEYRHIPDDVFYPARRLIMKRFLDKEYIYYTPEIRYLLENKARDNLTRWYG